MTDDLTRPYAEEQRLSQTGLERVRPDPLSSTTDILILSLHVGSTPVAAATARCANTDLYPPRHTFQRIFLVEEEFIQCALCSPFKRLAPTFVVHRRLRAELAASTAREGALRELLVPATERNLLDDEFDEEGVEMQPTVLLNPFAKQYSAGKSHTVLVT